jgi:coenzyme F420-reducing hydrogenase alpha subunit
MKSRTIKVNYLARVEGEGALSVKVKGGRVVAAELKIFEPPRFFEAFLRGRKYWEVPDITSRICGICPVAYQMSAVHALEGALGVTVEGTLRALRRLIYLGEWIESHGLHVILLHAPDFLGYPDALRMAQDHPDTVKLGLKLKKAGNDLVATLGGREIHPVNVRVGGFHRVPAPKEFARVKETFLWARDAAMQAVRWVAGLNFPEFEQDYEFVALRQGSEYPLNEGRLVSSRGLDIAVADYEEHFAEEQVPYSHALHSSLKGRGPYLVGPLARFNLNYDLLSSLARHAARDAGLEPGCINPFKSILVRAVEMVHAVDEALGLMEAYEKPEAPAVKVEPRAGVGYGATEAPRGVLYHRYRLDEAGVVMEAKIVPPTAQNQKRMEADLHSFVEARLDLPEERLTWQCEQLIRNYDPCISCATHFLKLRVDRVG